MERSNVEWEKGRPIVKYRDTLNAVICAKTAELIEMPLVCGLGWAQRIVLDGGPDPPWDTLQSPVRK